MSIYQSVPVERIERLRQQLLRDTIDLAQQIAFARQLRLSADKFAVVLARMAHTAKKKAWVRAARRGFRGRGGDLILQIASTLAALRHLVHRGGLVVKHMS